MSFDKPDNYRLPDEPAKPMPFGQEAPKKKSKPKSMTPTFLGEASTPNITQLGSKTLLGGAT